MKTIPRLIALALVSCFSSVAGSQSEAFIGTWQAGINRAADTTNITITIVVVGKTLGGTMVFLNPDHTVMEANITNPSSDGQTFLFQTMLGRDSEPCHWSLTLNNDGKTAVLKGHEHEMLVEETAFKK